MPPARSKVLFEGFAEYGSVGRGASDRLGLDIVGRIRDDDLLSESMGSCGLCSSGCMILGVARAGWDDDDSCPKADGLATGGHKSGSTSHPGEFEEVVVKQELSEASAFSSSLSIFWIISGISIFKARETRCCGNIVMSLVKCSNSADWGNNMGGDCWRDGCSTTFLFR